MARPRKEPRLRKDVDLRIPLTAEQKQLVVQAAAAAQSDVATWLRPIILQVAMDRLAKAQDELRRLTPPNEELLRAAKSFPPPPEWFEEEEEKPF
jgi:hypothetical protein